MLAHSCLFTAMPIWQNQVAMGVNWVGPPSPFVCNPHFLVLM